MGYFLRLAALAGAVFALLAAAPAAAQDFRVLVFSKTAAFRHSSIPDGLAMIEALGAANDFAVDATEDASAFTTGNLAQYAAVVWLSTTGDVLNSSQQTTFRNYVESGGAWVGVHAATDTEYAWPWYGTLIGGDAWFDSHPAQQTATLLVEDQTHASTGHYPPSFSLFEEWYNFASNPRASVNVLVTIDEASYSGGNMGADHPLSWYHSVGAGRSWYTAMGHRTETYSDAGFRQHVLGGILWAANTGAGGTAACTTVPIDDCVHAGGGSIDIDERIPGREKAKIALKKLADATLQSDFGDPVTANTGYAICLYEDGGELRGEMRINRAGHLCGKKSCWKPLSTKGYKYGDKAAAADGVRKLQLKSDTAGKGLVQANGRNDAAKGKSALPSGIAAAMSGQGAATVQIVSSDAGCFDATLTDVRTADSVRFRAGTP